MFPERIGRMVLDGNVDPDDYTNTGWFSNLQDNNKNLHWFYSACFHAGSKCPLVDEHTDSLRDVEYKVLKVLKMLKENPLPVVHDGMADFVTDTDMAYLIHNSAYTPQYRWPVVAQAAHDLLHGNSTTIAKYLRKLQLPERSDMSRAGVTGSILARDSRLRNETWPYPPNWPASLEGGIAVLCGDGSPINTLTKHDWQQRLSFMKNQSAIAGPFWAAIPFACQHWPLSLRPFERNRFTGPFRSKLADYDKRASPLLFIGNTADPVTPLANAIENSKHHEGSRVLIQDTPGHCAGPANPSRCSFEVIRKFFADGTLPEEGKVCAGDYSPWDEGLRSVYS